MAIATSQGKENLAIAYGTSGGFGALFTADPGSSGTATGEVTGGSPAYARKALTWVPGSADGVNTATATFDVPSGATVTFAGVCSSASGATVLDKVAVTSQAFASQGTFTVTFTFTQT